MKKIVDRKSFLKKGILGSLALFSLPSYSQKEQVYKTTGKLNLPTGSTLLFQGDSITDGRRDRKNTAANSPGALGHGYVSLIAGQLLGTYPAQEFSIYNRGISGNKIPQLKERWEEDCISLRPDVLSILIGVNDFWHLHTNGYTGTLESYEEGFRSLLRDTQEALPETKIILCEPFMVPGGTALKQGWPESFAGYRVVARKLAFEFQLPFVSFQEVFYEALEKADVSYWCPDGVHPGPAGSYLMAQAWIDVFEEMQGK